MIEYFNYGDINYLDYGGNLVWHECPFEPISSDLYKYCYNVFELYTPWDLGEEKYIARLHSIDVRDYEKYKKDLLYLIGEEDKTDIDWLDLFNGNMSVLANEIVSCGFSDNYNSYRSFYPVVEYVSRENVKDWLMDLEIDVEELERI